MKEIKLNITLSNVLSLLSEAFLFISTEILEFGRGIINSLAKSFKKQIRFLLNFDYSKESIKNHFLMKAANFFGFDLSEGDVKKSRRGRRKKGNISFKKRKEVKEKQQIDAVIISNGRKKSKKNQVNFYQPLE